MPPPDDKESPPPEANRIWETFQKETVPYLMSKIPDKLFSQGHEAELFVALNEALYDKYVADGVLIPRDIHFKMQLDICHLMPAFANLPNQEELLNKVFDKREPIPEVKRAP